METSASISNLIAERDDRRPPVVTRVLGSAWFVSCIYHVLIIALAAMVVIENKTPLEDEAIVNGCTIDTSEIPNCCYDGKYTDIKKCSGADSEIAAPPSANSNAIIRGVDPSSDCPEGTEIDNDDLPIIEYCGIGPPPTIADRRKLKAEIAQAKLRHYWLSIAAALDRSGAQWPLEVDNDRWRLLRAGATLQPDDPRPFQMKRRCQKPLAVRYSGPDLDGYIRRLFGK